MKEMYTIDSQEDLAHTDLLARVDHVFKNAFQKGELVFEYDTDSSVQMYHESGLDYQFKIINALSKRPINRKSTNESENKKFNPFLKNEPDLTVCDIFLKKYKLLLNKFPNSENHFLMVTKEFVKQDTLLSNEDLSAIYSILTNLNADSEEEFFSFFNSGHQSGYSQIHKHVQFLTFPTYKDGEDSKNFKTFADDFIANIEYDPELKPLTRPDVSFKHFILPLPKDKSKVTPQLLSDIYTKLITSVLNIFKANKLLKSSDSLVIDNELNPDISYNFIATSRYIVLVPRSSAKYQDCWANSLQFMGLFSGKNQEIKDKILEMGFGNYLAKVGFPNDGVDYSDVNNLKL